MGNSTVIYTGSFSFPEGDAGAARVLGIGKALRALGYEVLFGGGEAEGRAEDRIAQNGYRYQGFEYAPQCYLNRGNSSPFRRFLQVAGQGLDTLRWIDGYRSRGLAAIIAYEPSIPLQLRPGSYARRYGISSDPRYYRMAHRTNPAGRIARTAEPVFGIPDAIREPQGRRRHRNQLVSNGILPPAKLPGGQNSSPDRS